MREVSKPGPKEDKLGAESAESCDGVEWGNLPSLDDPVTPGTSIPPVITKCCLLLSTGFTTGKTVALPDSSPS